MDDHWPWQAATTSITPCLPQLSSSDLYIPLCGNLPRDTTGEDHQASNSYIIPNQLHQAITREQLLDFCSLGAAFALWCNHLHTSSDMTRRLVYGGALIAFLAGKCLLCPHTLRDQLTEPLTAFALTLASIIIPRWISWDSETVRLLPSHTSQRPLVNILPFSPVATRFTTPTVSTAAVPLSATPANTSPTKKTAMVTAISAPCGAPSVFSHHSQSS